MNEPIQIKTREDFRILLGGEVVQIDNRIGRYLGDSVERTCGCTWPVNHHYVPLVIYDIDGEIQKELIFSKDKPQKGKITGVSTIERISTEDERHQTYDSLLREVNLRK